MIINFISDIATPHVNELLRAVSARSDVRLNPWYSAEDKTEYKWRSNPTHAVTQARLFGARWPSARLLKYALSHPDEKFVVVGWSNPTTRVLVPMFDIARRRFAFFTDHPVDDDRGFVIHTAREAYLGVLRRRAQILAVGARTVDYFVRRRFRRDRVCNLPMPVPKFPATVRASRDDTRRQHGVRENDLFIVTGSRLVRQKGFDVLLGALGLLSPEEIARVRLMLVGSGPEEDSLKSICRDRCLDQRVEMAPWMEYDEFARCVAAADVVVHPARFDAYGGTSLTAVALGVPVIGSRGAGSAIDLVEDKVSGFIYDPDDTNALMGHLRFFLKHPRAGREMGRAAEMVADRRSADKVADILVNRLGDDPRSP